jgi:predicted ATPase
MGVCKMHVSYLKIVINRWAKKEDHSTPMLTSEFIGREAELQRLRDLAIRAMNNQGSTLFIKATAGMGASALLGKFEERIYNDPELNETVLINVELDRFGTEDPYYPFVEILESFEKPKLKGKDIARKAIEIITETAPDWLDILPAVGPAIKAVAKTAAKAADITFAKGNSSQAEKGIILTNQYVNTILEIASYCKLLVLAIQDARTKPSYYPYLQSRTCRGGFPPRGGNI